MFEELSNILLLQEVSLLLRYLNGSRIFIHSMRPESGQPALNFHTNPSVFQDIVSAGFSGAFPHSLATSTVPEQ